MPYKDYQKQIAAAKASYARYVARTTVQERTERTQGFPSRSPTARRIAHLKERYGLTLEQWEVMFEAQGRKCAICDATTPGWKRAWHTDHDHRTGRVRGILCHLCNRTVGNYGIERFQAFIDYLRRGKSMAQRWWHDKEVVSERAAVAGDEGFEEGQTKLVIVLGDRSRHTVPRSEVSDTMKVKPAQPATQSLKPEKPRS